MKFLSKLYLTFNFSERDRYESRSSYSAEIIEEAKRYLVCHPADILEISGEMCKSDIKTFRKLLKTDPLSIKQTERHHKYSVTFVISTAKLLNGDSDETSL